jgi:hypothetical protein
MQYVFLIYDDEANSATTPEAIAAEINAYNAFGEDARASGVMVGGEALHPVNTATTVRVRDGKTLTTDGPFAETKEVLGGYYVLDCKDLDEAIAWAAKIPASTQGSVEVRPLIDFSQM